MKINLRFFYFGFSIAIFAEVDSGNCKTTKIELFEKVVNRLKLPTIFEIHPSFCLGHEYASGLTKKEEQYGHHKSLT